LKARGESTGYVPAPDKQGAFAMRWLNAGISALVAFLFIRLFDLSINGAAFVFLVVFVVLSLTGSSFGGIWNSGLWTTLPARRCIGAVADAAIFIATALASWWLVFDVLNVPYLVGRVVLWANRNGVQRVDSASAAWAVLLWPFLVFLLPFKFVSRYKTMIGTGPGCFAPSRPVRHASAWHEKLQPPNINDLAQAAEKNPTASMSSLPSLFARPLREPHKRRYHIRVLLCRSAMALAAGTASPAFLDDGRIEIDSNTVERAMRPVALTRKNSLFAGSDEGAESWAILASLIETCKLHGVNPEIYFTAVLTKLVNNWPNRRISELLPWAWTAGPH
jgi:hypothetical protein